MDANAHPSSPSPDDAPLVERIGPYTIRSRIGEGGFGQVYLAEQAKPVRRLVALKVLKSGNDSPRVVARFQAEQQALALMDHPNVAHVYTTGVTEHGRPYFAMEYIDGPSIIEFCNGARLTIEDRIALFIAVCDGIQHAHARGIIHRDIKPTNIVISLGATPTPKIIDFGIAKAMDGLDSDDASLPEQTQTGRLVGTPTYASPEQILGSGDSVDLRTDVYSLGVVLTELLAGALPLDLRGLHGAMLTQTATYADPTLPSDLPATMPLERANAVAAERRTTVAALERKLRGDLDGIVRKALEKEPSDRYASAIELSADLVRALHHQPIRARPAGRLYRAQKLLRRRGRVIALSALTGCVVLAASAFAVVRTLEAARARSDSYLALKQRADAQSATVDMLELLVGLLRDEYTESAPGTRRMDLKTRLEQISARSSALAIDPHLEADLRLHLGRAFLSLREFDRAEAEASRCADLASPTSAQDPLPTLRAQLLMAAIAREAGDLQRSRSTLEELHLGLERVHESSDSSSAKSIEVASLHAKHALEVGLTSLASGENERALADFNESIDRSPPRSIGHIALVNAARAGKIDGLLALQRAREAELLAHELLTAQTSTLPAGHRWIAATRSALGEALYLQGRADAAEPLVASAHSILSTALSAESSLVRASRRRMDELAMRLGRAVRTAPDVPETVPEVRAADIAKPN